MILAYWFTFFFSITSLASVYPLTSFELVETYFFTVFRLQLLDLWNVYC